MPTNYLVTEQELNAVADAIKAKNGTSGKLRWPTEMVSAIQNITTGVDTSDATVTANDLLSGVIAYGSDGTSITGSIPIRQSTDTFFEGMQYGPRNFNTIGYGQLHFSSGYYGGEHFPILNYSDYTITPSTSSQSIIVFGSIPTYEYFPRAITIEAMPITDWSASGSINIDENKVLSNTYFYNSTGSLTQGNIPIQEPVSTIGTIRVLHPSEFDDYGYPSIIFEPGYYGRDHGLAISSGSNIIVIPSTTSQTISLYGSQATYDYFPLAINIESYPATDWTGGGSVNITSDKVLSDTYFYNSTGTLMQGNIPIQEPVSTAGITYTLRPSHFNQYGYPSITFEPGYYGRSHVIAISSGSSITITPSTTSQTISLYGSQTTYDYFPRFINIESCPTTDWTGGGSINITSDKVLSNTYFYNSVGSLTNGNIVNRTISLSTLPPSSFYKSGYPRLVSLYFPAGYYSQSHYMSIATTTTSWVITPGSQDQTFQLLGTNYSTQTYKPTGFSSGALPQNIIVKSASTIDWTGNGSINITSDKVLSDTYFYNSAGSLKQGNIPIILSSKSGTFGWTIKPSQFDNYGYAQSHIFETGYYGQLHRHVLQTSSTSSIITITPSTSSQTITLFGSSATYDYFPLAINIESSITDWTGNGSVNIEPNKVLSNTYFYNSTGSLQSGLISNFSSSIIYVTPSNFDQSGQFNVATKIFNSGYYSKQHTYYLQSSTSSIITITPSTTSQTISLYGPQATYNYFPHTISIESMITLSTSIQTLYPYQILNTGIPANTSQYFSSSYYYTKSHYTSINTTTTPWTITPSTTSKTIYLFGTSYSTQTNKPSGFSSQAFPQSIIVESYTSTPAQITISSTDWIMNRSLISGYFSNNTITKIDAGTFVYCTNLLSINLPNCTTISSEAFRYCSSLQSAYFSKCTTIGYNAFIGCSNLQSISFPICTTIEDLVFQNCSNLSIANFPQCKTIGSYAFTNCFNLQSITFPTCSFIGQNTFRSCQNLTTASFPKCTTIGSYAFTSCYRLTTLILKNSTVAVLSNTNAFTSTPISTFTSYTSGVYGSIYVPTSLVAAYKSATNWAIYSNRITSTTS